jgi:MFS family permease
MVGVVVTAVVPDEKYGKYMAIISSVFAVASILGPLLGGAINDSTTWRWVFLSSNLNPKLPRMQTLMRK